MDRGDPLSSLGLVVAMLGDERSDPHRSCRLHRRIIVRQSSCHVEHELIAAGMLILAGGGHGVPLKYTELERWTRVGYERGIAIRRGER